MEKQIKKVNIYTDGACSGNPGPGGYAAILKYRGEEKVIAGGEQNTTNNRMEMTAAIQGLLQLTEPCHVTLYSDSRYLVDGITKNWAKSWRKNGWNKSDGKPALNTDLWEKLLDVLQTHTVDFVWIRGHEGHTENERCDKLAVEQSRSFAKR